MKVYFELYLHFTGLFVDSFSLQQNQRIFNEFVLLLVLLQYSR